jgi:hypothetical protein
LESLVRGIPTLAGPSAMYARDGLAHVLGDDAGETIASAAVDPAPFRPDHQAVDSFLTSLVSDHLLAGDVRALTPLQAEAIGRRIRALRAAAFD